MDIQRLILEVSGVDASGFFKDHVLGNKAIDFNKHLSYLGLRMDLQWTGAKNNEGAFLPDTRLWIYEKEGKFYLHPVRYKTSAWWQAGLQPNDEIISINGNPLKKTQDYYSVLRQSVIGDEITLDIRRREQLIKVKVKISGYDQPVVKLSIIDQDNPLLQQWLKALPERRL